MPYPRFPKCFLSASFDPVDRDVFEWFRGLVDAVGFEVITGEAPTPRPPAETVRTRIEGCSALVAVYTRRDQLGVGGEWKPPTFVTDEVAIAFSMGKPVAIFAENGVKVEGVGPQATTYERWDRSDLAAAARTVVRYLMNLRNEVSPPLELQGDVPTARALVVELGKGLAQLDAVEAKLELGSWNFAYFFAGLSGRLLTLPNDLVVAVEGAYGSQATVSKVLEAIESAREGLRPKVSLPRWASDEPLPPLPSDNRLWEELRSAKAIALQKHRWAMLKLLRFGWPSEWRSMGIGQGVLGSMTPQEFKRDYGHDLSEVDVT